MSLMALCFRVLMSVTDVPFLIFWLIYFLMKTFLSGIVTCKQEPLMQGSSSTEDKWDNNCVVYKFFISSLCSTF